MTVKAFAAIRRQAVLVAATAALVVLAALAVHAVLPTAFIATAELRFSPAATAVIQGGTGYGSIQLDLYADAVTSPQVLDVAAEAVGVPRRQLAGALAAEIVPGTTTRHLHITAVTGSPQQSASFANAAAQAYIAHLTDQLTAGVADIHSRQEALRQTQRNALLVLQTKPTDTLANYQLSQTTTQLTALQGELDAITTAGAPASLLNSARPGTPTGVPLVSTVLIALLTGLLAGVGVGLVRDQFDDGLRPGDDAAALAGAPLLGALPRAARWGRTASRLPAAQPGSVLADSMNRLRATLATGMPSGSVIAVTSGAIGDGKTFVASNLAVTWARGGRFVVLVDANLRRPRLQAVFTIPDGGGLAAAVENPDAVADLLESTLHDKVVVLPAGRTDRDPADLLALDGFSDVLARLRGLADVVIIDTPPAGELADAALVASLADATVVVVSPGRTDRRALPVTVRSLRSQGAHVVGLVANRWVATGGLLRPGGRQGLR